LFETASGAVKINLQGGTVSENFSRCMLNPLAIYHVGEQATDLNVWPMAIIQSYLLLRIIS
jgi:hypothetical protein